MQGGWTEKYIRDRIFVIFFYVRNEIYEFKENIFSLYLTFKLSF
jgi:hypothetical protein